jgi:hypothetical protein
MKRVSFNMKKLLLNVKEKSVRRISLSHGGARAVMLAVANGTLADERDHADGVYAPEEGSAPPHSSNPGWSPPRLSKRASPPKEGFRLWCFRRKHRVGAAPVPLKFSGDQVAPEGAQAPMGGCTTFYNHHTDKEVTIPNSYLLDEKIAEQARALAQAGEDGFQPTSRDEAPEMTGVSLGLFSTRSRIRHLAFFIINHRVFEGIVMGFIILSGVRGTCMSRDWNWGVESCAHSRYLSPTVTPASFSCSPSHSFSARPQYLLFPSFPRPKRNLLSLFSWVADCIGHAVQHGEGVA